jgi:hypothetical protein
MPIHNWTRVTAGTFHDFHLSWIGELKRVLNGGLLPKGYYAMAEQVAGEMGPDVIALHTRRPNGEIDAGPISGATAVAAAPPQVSLVQELSEDEVYAHRRRTLVIRHTSGDEVVALIEIISPGNKSGAGQVERQIDKIASAVDANVSVLVIDLFPPGRHDPHGLHGAFWEYVHGGEFSPPRERPLTLVSYSPGQITRAYVESVAVGMPLPEMPLFLNDEWYINAPLEATYRDAYATVAQRCKDVLEARSNGA